MYIYIFRVPKSSETKDLNNLAEFGDTRNIQNKISITLKNKDVELYSFDHFLKIMIFMQLKHLQSAIYVKSVL